MPVMQASRRGPCVACGLPIESGERIEYERARGARHLTCTDRDAGKRRNLYRMSCQLCGCTLRRGQGALECIETERDGHFERRWVASCVDVVTCRERIQRGGVQA